MARIKPTTGHVDIMDRRIGDPADNNKLSASFHQINAIQGCGTGENTRYVNFLVEVSKIALKADKSRPETLQECFLDYLQLCADWDMRIGNMAAYAAMGLSQDDAANIMRSKNEQAVRLQPLIQQVKRICSMSREQLANENKVNPVLTIFWQKNYDGLRDEATYTVQTNNPLGDEISAASIMEKYKMLPDD